MLSGMAYTQTDLDRINAALASGNLTVRSGNDQVTYQSVDEMMRVKRLIGAELAQASGQKRMHPRYQQAMFHND